MRIFFFLFVFCANAICCMAQDIHFAQFKNVPLGTNPALAGVMVGNHRFTANVRRQWASIAGNEAWEQAHFSFDGRKCLGFNFLAFGIHIQSDRMGLPSFSNTTAAATVAYHLRMKQGAYFSAGLSAGALHYRIGSSGRTFDEQFGTNGYDPTLPNFENFETGNRTVPDLSAGLLLFSPGLNGWTMGVALHHVNQPTYSFFEKGDNRLGMGVSFHGSKTITLADASTKSRLTLRGLYRRQSIFKNSRQWQLLPGLSWRYGSGRREQEKGFQLGASLRLGGHAEGKPATLDAIVPSVQLNYETLSLGFSYDVNVSSAADRTGLRGGLEVSVAWMLSAKAGCVVCPEY